MGCKAALTQLGRNRPGEARVKHHIKAVDRLLGNEHLHRESSAVYRAIAQTLLAGVAQPVLTVDWSDFECGGSRKWAMIQAAVPIGGRAVVVYTRVFPFKRYNSPGAHRMPAFAALGSARSRLTAGTGSEEFETRSSTSTRTPVDGASATRCIGQHTGTHGLPPVRSLRCLPKYRAAAIAIRSS